MFQIVIYENMGIMVSSSEFCTKSWNIRHRQSHLYNRFWLRKPNLVPYLLWRSVRNCIVLMGSWVKISIQPKPIQSNIAVQSRLLQRLFVEACPWVLSILDSLSISDNPIFVVSGDNRYRHIHNLFFKEGAQRGGVVILVDTMWYGMSQNLEARRWFWGTRNNRFKRKIFSWARGSVIPTPSMRSKHEARVVFQWWIVLSKAGSFRRRVFASRWELPILPYDLHESNNKLILIILEIFWLDSLNFFYEFDSVSHW